MMAFQGISQPTGFTTNPAEAQFITSDIPLFWAAFDQSATDKHAFKAYLKKGSQGVQDFIPMRIESARNLRKVVVNRKSDYETIRETSLRVTDSLSPFLFSTKTSKVSTTLQSFPLPTS